MFCKSKRVALFMLELLTVIALFVGCTQGKPLEPVNLDDRPMVAYMKLEGKDNDMFSYSLKVCSFDGEPQVAVYPCDGFIETTSDGNFLFYKLVQVNKKQNRLYDLYYMDRTGTSQLVTKEVAFYELSENGYAVLYGKALERGIFIKEYTADGTVIREESLDNMWSYNLNSIGNTMLLLFKQNEEDPVGDIYLYEDGQMEKVAEDGRISSPNHIVSDDGTILYVTDGVRHGEDILWTLYRKEKGRDAEKLVSDCTYEHYLSNDGGLTAAIVMDDNGKKALFYQYVGEEPVFVEDIVQFEMGMDSNTLYYIAGDKTDWRLPLYRVVEGTEPVIVADNVAAIIDVSKDGKSVAFAANFDRENKESELYIAREGEEIEFVDSGIRMGENKRGEIVPSKIILYYDGSAIAYQKGAYDEYGQFRDLYVKEKGKEPKKIDEQIISEFDFLK